MSISSIQSKLTHHNIKNKDIDHHEPKNSTTSLSFLTLRVSTYSPNPSTCRQLAVRRTTYQICVFHTNEPPTHRRYQQQLHVLAPASHCCNHQPTYGINSSKYSRRHLSNKVTTKITHFRLLKPKQY